ncbi:phosphatase inhibitor-domain-containing protein [Ochromonadaceae sp. CCMP2298]|nr:phosphatase inhibitor-domain-containing protein [Ochromonadaceae sp. CCMP2298]|mmetsp:Transcript_11/g.18  ORF Transcript_11/g.18 Transcript_11/m.18 type:complete len:103 (+) Transcript_11:193-501(+)
MDTRQSVRTQQTQVVQAQEAVEKKKLLVLKLKQSEEEKPAVKWTEDTVDNEGLGRKSSKRCCIFHKNRAFAESDSDESDSDTEVAKKQLPGARPPNYQRHHA